jgi:hypothetical protein
VVAGRHSKMLPARACGKQAVETLTPEGLSYRRIPSREVEEQDFGVLDTG